MTTSTARILKKIMSHGSRNSFAFTLDVAVTVVPLIIFGREDEVHNSASQLTNILFLTVVFFRQYSLSFNNSDFVDPENKKENTKVYNQVFAFNILTSVFTIGSLYGSSYFILPVSSFNLNPKAVILTQQFMTYGAIAAVFHLFERAQQQFIFGTSKKNGDNVYSTYKLGCISWKHIPLVVSTTSMLICIGFIAMPTPLSLGTKMGLAYLIPKFLAVSAYTLIFKAAKAFEKDPINPGGFLGYDKIVNDRIKRNGLMLIGLLALEILFPVVQSFLVAQKSNRDLALYGVSSFIFNIFYVVCLGYSNGITSVSSSQKSNGLTAYHKTAKVACTVLTGLFLTYMLPFVVAPNETLNIFAKDKTLVADVKNLLIPLGLWALSGAVGNALTGTLRAVHDRKTLIISRGVTQWIVNLAGTTALIFGFKSSVSPIIWSNAITNTLFAGWLLYAVKQKKGADLDIGTASSRVELATTV